MPVIEPTAELRQSLVPPERQTSLEESSEAESLLDAAPAKPARSRLDFLDWLRFTFVCVVVFAHVCLSGLKGNGGFEQNWVIDDHTLFNEKSYMEHMYPDPSSMPTGPSPLSMRWISTLRQWALPGLFWVSGAAGACSYRGGMPRGMPRILALSAVGMLSNAVLWYTSPQDSSCIIDTPECQGRGLLFDFHIASKAGAWFAVVFQMWYTLMLVVFMLLSWPLFSVVHGEAGVCGLCAHYVVTMSFLGLLIFCPLGDGCPRPALAMAELCLLEAAFVALLAIDAPRLGRQRSSDWIPLRLQHYLMALVCLLQFACVPYADSMKSIGAPYLAFIGCGFLRCYQLGFVMTHARQGPEVDRAPPLCSQVWPIMLWILNYLLPSTNWQLAGMLTYPYYVNPVDRCFYIGGALMILFFIDRASRGVQAASFPFVLNIMSLVVYLFHPWFITFLLKLGMRDAHNTFVVCLVLAFAMVFSANSLLQLRRGSGRSEPIPAASPIGSDDDDNSSVEDEEEKGL